MTFHLVEADPPVLPWPGWTFDLDSLFDADCHVDCHDYCDRAYFLIEPGPDSNGGTPA
jgi:hypothetical protein